MKQEGGHYPIDLPTDKEINEGCFQVFLIILGTGILLGGLLVKALS